MAGYLGVGKKIGIGVGIAFGAFVALGVIGMMVANNGPELSSTGVQIQEKQDTQAVAAPPAPFFTDANFMTLYASPDTYIDSSVEITGKIFIAPERDGKRSGFQMWQAGKVALDRNTLVYSDFIDLTKFAVDDCVKVNGKNQGRLEGENAFGATLNIVTIDAYSVLKVDCEAVIYPAIKTIEVGQTQTTGGIEVTLEKVVFAEDHTRAYLKVVNTNTDGKIYFLTSDSKAFQGNKQFDTIYAFDVDFPEIEYEIYPGVEENGIILFEPLNSAADNSRFHFVGRGSSFLNDYYFDFTI